MRLTPRRVVMQLTMVSLLMLLLKDQGKSARHVDKETEIINKTKNTRGPKLPSVGVVGVKKCGTGALIEIMRMHPRVVAPPYEQTEVEFWGIPQLMQRGIQYYQVIVVEK